MTQLYTVRYKRQQIITRFEGRKKTETVNWIEEVHHDLPLQTAQMYLSTMPPENNCRIERQQRATDDRQPKSRVRFLDEERALSKAPSARPRATPKIEKPVAPPSDYAAVVNSMMEKAR